MIWRRGRRRTWKRGRTNQTVRARNCERTRRAAKTITTNQKCMGVLFDSQRQSQFSHNGNETRRRIVVRYGTTVHDGGVRLRPWRRNALSRAVIQFDSAAADTEARHPSSPYFQRIARVPTRNQYSSLGRWWLQLLDFSFVYANQWKS